MIRLTSSWILLSWFGDLFRFAFLPMVCNKYLLTNQFRSFGKAEDNLMEAIDSETPKEHQFLGFACIPRSMLCVPWNEECMSRLAAILNTLNLHHSLSFQHVIPFSLLMAMQSHERLLVGTTRWEVCNANVEFVGRGVRRVENLFPASCCMALIASEVFNWKVMDIGARKDKWSNGFWCCCAVLSL